MRWPLRRRPRAAAPLAPSADAGGTHAPRHELDPRRSRPRADWARLAPIHPASPRPPITFDGERFGRTVAGARPLLARPRPGRSRTAPAGVLLDVAAVETIVPRVAHPAHPAAPPPPVGTEPGLGGRPVAPHRPAVGRHAGDPLTRADGVMAMFDWSPAEPRVAALPDTPLTWTTDDGFEPAPGTVRRVRPRPATAVDDEPSRSEPSEPTEPQLRYLPASGRRHADDERPAAPGDIVLAVAAATGVHVGDTVIDRSPTAAEQADDLGAVAFTRHGVVHLPGELGPLDDPVVRSVLAHELTHVAQHRRRAGDVPPEDTPEGHLLEGEARAVERSIRGTAVRPTFQRRHPRQLREGPAGVQRLAHQVSDYAGPDYTSVDFTDVEPGSSNDLFAWQRREGEPYGVPWSERRRWDEDFETQNAERLQRDRDEHFRRLADQAGPALTEAQLPPLRERLDQERPYQFGGPAFGVDPYPDVRLADAAATDGAAATGAPVARSVPGGNPPQPPDPVAEAERDASRRRLRAMALESRRTVADHPAALTLTHAALLDRLHQRRDLERSLRSELLEAKRAEAEEHGAERSHIVPLTRDEIDEIRDLVDAQLPAGGVDYLDLTEHASVTVGGNFGGFVEPEDTGPVGRHRRVVPPLQPAGAASRRSAAVSAGAPGGAASPGAADELLAALRDTRPVAPVGVFNLTRDELMRQMHSRHDKEAELRRQVLTAKRSDLGAEREQLPNDFAVCLTADDLATIRAAVDAEFPQIVGLGLYRGDDEFASLGLDDQWGPFVADPEQVDDAIARHRREQGLPDAAPATTSATAGSATTATAAGAVAPTPPASAPPASPPPPVAPTPASPTDRGAIARSTPPAHTDAPTAGQPAVPERAVAAEADDEPVNIIESLSEIDLERLTRRMWHRIRRELRGELLIDRERAGVLADMR